MKNLIFGILFLVGCSQVAVKNESKPFEFNSFVEEHLGGEVKARKPPFCKTWLEFIRGVVKAESNWKNDAVYTEKFVDTLTGKLAVSVGYFQLSIGDKLHYKGKYCGSLTEENLKDAEQNTGCALEIMETLFIEGKSLGKYWSVVRDGKVRCDG